ncbi:ATP-binding protein [Actinoplanes sp. NPDC024001]|uniref:ATP-binding protein n=1 Tax=Actinoplanes sp. NPDC024001 TaxID=3154598 RepID=UPI0033FDAAB0
MNQPHLVVDTPQVSCVNEPEQLVTQVVVRGPWDGRLRHQVAQVLRAAVAETPELLLIDLAALDDPYAESASTWRITSRFAEQNDPPVSMVLCAAAPALRHQLAAEVLGEPTLTQAGTVGAAVAETPRRDATAPRRHLRLPPWPSACVRARTLAGDTCLAFGLAHLVHPVRLTASELVANAVEHAGTDMDLWISVRDTMLHVAVHDGSPRLPRLIDAAHPWEPGAGLRIVAAAATAWGALPTQTGKIVWATFATQHRPVS